VELPDFFDVVIVLDSEQTRRRGIAGEVGVILGRSTEDDSLNGRVVSYAVSVRDEVTMVDPELLSLTGRKADPEEFYPGESIRVSVEGDYLGPGKGSDGSGARTD